MAPLRRSSSQSPISATSRANRRRASLSRNAAIAARCGPMSRAIFEPPTMLPAASRIGDIVIDTSTGEPSFLRRTVSNGGTTRPVVMLARIAISSCARSGGINIFTEAPTASCAV